MLKSPGFFRVLFILVLLVLVNVAQAESNSADSDYAAYASSRFASSKWNDFVKEGMTAYHSGDYDVAQTNLYKAFNSGCESPLVLFQLALLAEYQKSYYSALEYYQMAKAGFQKANRDHRYAKDFNENYGRALYNAGKIEEAIPILQAAAKKTQSFWLLKMVGMMAYEKGDTLNATSYFERAVRVNSPDVTIPELVQIYTLLARLFLSKSEKDGALRNYSKVLELEPGNKEAKEFLAAIRRSYEQDKMMKMIEEM